MTRNKHFKALVRARMARTGEVYTAARDALLAELGGVRLELVETIQAHDKHCIAVRFTRDGRELLTGGFGGQARAWSTADWSRVGELVGHTASVNGFGLDAGGGAITVSSDGTVRLWDVPGRRERGVLAATKKVGMGVDIRSDGALAATGGTDGTIRLHDLEGGLPAGDPRVVRVEGRVMTLAFEPGGRRLAAGTVGGGLLLLGEDGSVEARIEAFDPVVNVRWSPDGAFLVASGSGGAVALFATDQWEEVRRITVGAGSLLPIVLSPDGGLLAVGWDNHVGLWRADTDDDAPAAVVDGLPKGVYALDFSPDGRLLAQGGADGRVRIFRVRAG